MASDIKLSARKQILFLLIVFAVFAAALEFGARLYLRKYQGYSGGPLLQYEFDPYKNVLPTRNFVDTRGVQHNSQGFRRSAQVSRIKPAGTYRIFLMGGSTAYGTGGLWPHLERDYPVLKNSETIDAYMERQLHARYPGTRFEVINAAIPSIWTHHHLIYLNQTILKYEPDMVVLLDGYNDFYLFGKDHDQFESYAYKEHSHTIMGEPTLVALAHSNLWWLGRKSAFAHVFLREAREAKQLFTRKERVPMNAQASFAGLQQAFPRNALEMVDRIAVLLREESVSAAFVLQPMLILERDRPGISEMERKLFEFNVSAYLPNYEAFMRLAVPFVRDLERQTVEGRGAIFIDGTTVFHNQNGQMFTDYVHLTPAANAILADHILEGIAPAIGTRIGKAVAAPTQGP